MEHPDHLLVDGSLVEAVVEVLDSQVLVALVVLVVLVEVLMETMMIAQPQLHLLP
tara:strand:+ start:323 stop:487 length:165 start_codon:yes stop_codon:yes gene_type:complete